MFYGKVNFLSGQASFRAYQEHRCGALGGTECWAILMGEVSLRGQVVTAQELFQVDRH